MLIAQITDLHVVESGELHEGRRDPSVDVARAVEHVNGLDPRPDVVVATGDLVDAGRPAQYEQLAALLGALEMPVLPVIGNHDDRTNLRAAFQGLAEGLPTGSFRWVVDGHPVRIIGLDTTIPGSHAGELGAEQLAWLDQMLSKQPQRPTLIAQHHPPFITGLDWMDTMGLADGDDERSVVARHRHVVGVVCGHIHRSISTAFGGTVASTCPSTGAQLALALDGRDLGYIDEPPAVALHLWSERLGLVSHLSYIDSPDPWYLPPT